MWPRRSLSRRMAHIVAGSVPLAIQTIGVDGKGDSTEWVEGRAFASSPQYALCPCGQSKTKPFCDGTHANIGFDGTETATMPLLRSRQPCLMARRCNSSMRKSYVHSLAFAIRMVKFGTRWKRPTESADDGIVAADQRLSRLTALPSLPLLDLVRSKT